MLIKTLPTTPWLETVDEYTARLKSVCATVNQKYDVGSLCREFPDRVTKMLEKQGDRLRK